ncbi:MAG: hypothetical protein U9N40_04435 [Euryarchaeota archaeon]|nr:hypothetical protein [Euryarchaeota archaeon]
MGCGEKMAKPIELSLVLEGDDARRFEQYINDPDDITPEGRQLLIEARELAKTMDLNDFRRY